MGTVNYKTAKWVTLAFPFVDTDDYLDEDGNVDYDAWRDDEKADFDNVSALRDKYEFCCLHVEVEPGYYEGCSIDVGMDYTYFDDWQEKQDAQKELTQLQRFLLECLENGMRVCHPGWCTSFKDYADSREAIREAIRKARDDVRKMPTYATLRRCSNV